MQEFFLLQQNKQIITNFFLLKRNKLNNKKKRNVIKMATNDQDNSGKDAKISEFNDDSIRDIAKEIIVKRYILVMHLWIYALVNLLLFAINYLADFSYMWFLWAITGWGIGLFIHIYSYIVFKKGVINYSSVGLIYHFGFYICVNIFLFFIDAFTTIDQGIVLDWFWWPFFSWTAVIALHLIVYMYVVPKKGQEEFTNWMDRKIEMELKKMKKN
jgi:2TM domain